MPVCISCRTPVKTLYTTYSKADDRALGKGVRLTQCPTCKQFADKYVEHDFVVLFIDLVLVKPEVYRHLLYNRLGREDDGFDRSILRLSILLLLFDVYLTWSRIEKIPLPSSTSSSLLATTTTTTTTITNTTTTTTTTPSPPPPLLTNATLLQAHPLLLQYLFFLALVTLSTLSFHLPIRLLCALPTTPRFPLYRRLIPYFPRPNPLSTALLVSSCTKLFPMLLLIWDYDLPSSATAVSWAVIVNNIVALEIVMGCGYVRAAVLVGVGAAGRGLVGWAVLRAAGLGTGWEGFLGEGVVHGVREWVRGAVGLW